MVRGTHSRWLIVLAIGMLGGMVLSGLWPQSPLYAVATDRIESFAMATGYVEPDIEAVYFLDFLTGDLSAVVLGKQRGTWSGFFYTNVSADLGIDQQKNPKYMMVTGTAYLRRAGGSRQQPSNAMCYVAEVTTGKVAAYAIPWASSMYSAGQPQKGQLVPMGVTQFRAPMGGGPGTGMGTPPAGPALKGRGE